jgi:hypothetical protein
VIGTILAPTFLGQRKLRPALKFCLSRIAQADWAIELLWFVLTILVSPFRSKARLEAEIAALRHQLIVLQRKSGGRVRLTNGDRLFFVQLYRWFPSILQVLQIIRPETLVR